MMTFQRLVIPGRMLVILVMMAISSCGGNPETKPREPLIQNIPVPPLTTRVPGRILMSHTDEQTGDFEIVVINDDNTGEMNLTRNPARDMLSAWSPDLSQIAFTSDRDGSTQLYVMRQDGSQVKQITRDTFEKGIPRYSPYLAWSPDGEWIGYTALVGETPDIFVVKPDGSELTNLTENPGEDIQFHWSPDGKSMVFLSDRNGNPDIYKMDFGGTRFIQLTDYPEVDIPTGWSPDGKSILFCSNRDGNWEVYGMNGDGSEQVNLTNNTADDTDPAFSPDGNQIAFRSNRDGTWKIFVMHADGTNTRVLSKNEGNDYWFWWSPDGQQVYIAYAIGPDLQNLSWKAVVVQIRDGATRPFPFGGSINWR